MIYVTQNEINDFTDTKSSVTFDISKSIRHKRTNLASESLPWIYHRDKQYFCVNRVLRV